MNDGYYFPMLRDKPMPDSNSFPFVPGKHYTAFLQMASNNLVGTETLADVMDEMAMFYMQDTKQIENSLKNDEERKAARPIHLSKDVSKKLYDQYSKLYFGTLAKSSLFEKAPDETVSYAEADKAYEEYFEKIMNHLIEMEHILGHWSKNEIKTLFSQNGKQLNWFVETRSRKEQLAIVAERDKLTLELVAAQKEIATLKKALTLDKIEAPKDQIDEAKVVKEIKPSNPFFLFSMIAAGAGLAKWTSEDADEEKNTTKETTNE